MEQQHTFTPFGFLQNPHYQCGTGYYDVQSGVLRSDLQIVGFGWVVPFPKRPHWVVSGGIGLKVGSQRLLTRDELEPFEVAATVHTPFRFLYRLRTSWSTTHADFWLDDRDRLACRVTHQSPDTSPEPIAPLLVARAWRPDGVVDVGFDGGAVRVERENDERFATPPVRIEARVDGAGEPPAWKAVGELRGPSDAVNPGSGENEQWFIAEPSSEQPVTVMLSLDSPEPRIHAFAPYEPAAEGHDAATAAAAQFESLLPRLIGSFPRSFQNGFHYDMETTRLCTLPPAGIFTGHWPTWMVSMPRAVLAEGTMDMARLSYADPDLAAEALLVLLRDTPLANTPCVFASGEYNMVAGDGTRCGTSPAWCIPFLNVYDVYLRTRDDSWMREIYPHLVALVDYWLAERVDSEGWLVYMCTWEAGEDNNPRIDPDETGDSVISDFVRPVELQASMAHAAMVLSTFAGQQGLDDDEKRFQKLHDEFVAKTQQLWDADAGRFRDYDRKRNAFVAVDGEERYWGADFTRQSPLSLIALLGGIATDEQRSAMRDEVRSFFRSPFAIWPSWSTFVLEAAAELGMYEFAASMAYEIVSRVYAASDRRSLGQTGGTRYGAMPGASPEYWPYDPATFTGNDAYAWGAQGASFVVRHILGIRNAEDSDGVGLRLRPAFPAGLGGREWGIQNLFHRGHRLRIIYRNEQASIICEVTFEAPAALSVAVGADGSVIYCGGVERLHQFALPIREGRIAEVILK